MRRGLNGRYFVFTVRSQFARAIHFFSCSDALRSEISMTTPVKYLGFPPVLRSTLPRAPSGLTIFSDDAIVWRLSLGPFNASRFEANGPLLPASSRPAPGQRWGRRVFEASR